MSAIFSKTSAQCDAPVNLTATYSNNISTFTWDNVSGSAAYTVEIKFQWDNTFSTLATVNTNSFSITGLFQTAPFDWRVTTDCGTEMSTPSVTQSYATPCPEPSSLSVTNINATSVTLNWVAAPGYNTTTSDFVVAYRLANTNNNWISLGHTSTTSMNITGLLSNTTYEWCVNQSCMYSNSNPVISQFTTTYIPCDVPTNITTSNVGATTATISWSAVSGGLNYSLEYKLATSNNWSTPIITTNTTKTLTGLTAATLYDCRVKAICANGTSTYITKQFTTYTSTCSAYGVNNSEYIDFFQLGNISRTSAREIGGYVNTNLSTTLVVGSTTNAGQFSAGYNPGIIFGEYFAVYIDFNNNGSFTDNNERVVSPIYVTSGSSNYNFNISIPNNANQGTRKMRVVMRRSGSPIVPCATGFNGEVEDYSVNLIRVRMANVEETVSTSSPEGIVYPNPSNGEFSFETQTELKSFSVTNLYGQIVLEKSLENSNAFKIDISHLAGGIYILTVQDNEGKFQYHKLQKN